jgi:hypothetical protein
MSGLRGAIVALACMASQAPAQASAIKIDGDTPRERITVTIEDVSVEAVLRDFSATYDFELRGVGNAERAEILSATMSGSLEDILTRLLRNRNHVIVRSADNASGIHRVIILGEGRSSTPPAAQEGESGDAPREVSRRHYSAQRAED